MHDLPAWNWKKQTIFPQDFVDEFVFHTLWYAIITSDDISSLGKDTAIIEEIIEFSFVEWMNEWMNDVRKEFVWFHNIFINVTRKTRNLFK